MKRWIHASLVVSGLLSGSVVRAATTVDYLLTAESVRPGQPPHEGSNRFRCVIDGATFTITSRNATESSTDDGVTTRFGSDPHKANAPLAAPHPGPRDGPIRGTLPDDRLVVGPSMPGPTLFGRSTRTYTIDHDFTIGGTVLLVPIARRTSHARYTMTVIDDGTSSAAVRVALSRGYPYVLSLHPEAFTGLPVRIDGRIASAADDVVTFHLEAEAFGRPPAAGSIAR